MPKPHLWSLFALLILAGTGFAAEPTFVKKATRVETILASLHESKLPTLEGTWHVIGPFDNADNAGFEAVYPPEKEIDLKKTYKGVGDKEVAWKEFADFKIGKVVSLLGLFKPNQNICGYLFHEITVADDLVLPISLGSDDGLIVFLNGKPVLSENVARPAAADQSEAELKLKAGKNQLLLKVCNQNADYAVYLCPELPKAWPATIRKQLERAFPRKTPYGNKPASLAAEAVHYRIATVPVPKDVVLEVGGLDFRPDGKLVACTRRGEVWLIANPASDDPKFTPFARGLHEALGLLVDDNNNVFVTQRPELTKLVDKDGDGKADEFITICDKWGVSGDYHEFAFGPARDKDGNFYITLNVGFGGGDQAKGAWRGWCVKVTPKGEMTPFATGLRSPNGVRCSPEGDLFYCDNQGEWVASNKMHHIREGEYYGHKAGLRWVKQSPFANTLPDRSHASGMLYDGQPPIGQSSPKGMPPLTPPCIWFPYGRMGQSASEPVWDTTKGKFGPFEGQCFVGDMTSSLIMRVALEKVNGRYQGACFPFRAGFQCGINRLVFGPDHSLYAGQTDRGWGSIGGKTHGLQRLIYTGVTPFEIHSMKLTPKGFELRFTKPLDEESAKQLQAYSLQSFTYNYWSTYGSEEVDRKAVAVQALALSADRRTVTLEVSGLRRGRVYELHLDGVKSADAEAVLHPEAYYTLNELP